MAPRRTCADSNPQEPARLLIAGLGNPLMADDGIGHAVVRGLEERDLSPGIRLSTIDGDVLALTELWSGEPAVWLVDAVSGGLSAGTVRIFEHRELLDLPADGFSTHRVSLSEHLRWLLHGWPEIADVKFRLYGIEVGAVRPERGLSPVCETAANRLVDQLQGAARSWAASSLATQEVLKGG